MKRKGNRIGRGKPFLSMGSCPMKVDRPDILLFSIALMKQPKAFSCRKAEAGAYMKVYIAPYVYWIDNPDDPRGKGREKTGKEPFGTGSKMSPYLHLVGLTKNPENVVLASSRRSDTGSCRKLHDV